MAILPLQQFEADLEADRKIYEQLKAPTSIVVRFGIMKLVGEFPYSGDAKPGCGSKMVVRTNRGTEIGEMLTSTCPNSGCSKSVSRKEMLEYIENSGGKDYPFFSQGRILRVATMEDITLQTQLDAARPKHVMEARRIVGELALPMKIVDAEPLLGGERITFYFTSEDRIDFRDLVNQLAAIHQTRIEMRQVGARDEARLVADYERCGQHCCCKQFLKVLKPVSMKSAKIQKATLDPLKISGRCGRLMCCLRYEDESYDELRKRLPRKKSRVLTPSGWGIVIDTQILTQLALVRLESNDTDVAIPVEELGTGPAEAPAADAAAPPSPTTPDSRPQRPSSQPRPPRAPRPAGPDNRAGAPPRQEQGRRSRDQQGQAPRTDRPRSDQPRSDQPRPDRQQPRPDRRRQGDRPPQGPAPQPGDAGPPADQRPQGDGAPRKRRRRRRRPGGGDQSGGGGPPPSQG